MFTGTYLPTIYLHYQIIGTITWLWILNISELKLNTSDTILPDNRYKDRNILLSNKICTILI